MLANEPAFFIRNKTKYQYSKVSAMLSNPDEFFRMLNALNGGGGDGQMFVDKQVELQLETLQRNMQMITADISALVNNFGANGMLDILTGIAIRIDNIIIGLSKLKDEWGYAAQWVIGITAVAGAIRSLFKLMQMYRATLSVLNKTSGVSVTIDNESANAKTKLLQDTAAYRATEQGLINSLEAEIIAGERQIINVDGRNIAITNETAAMMRNQIERAKIVSGISLSNGITAQEISMLNADTQARIRNELQIATGNTALSISNGVEASHISLLSKDTQELIRNEISHAEVASTIKLKDRLLTSEIELLGAHTAAVIRDTKAQQANTTISVANNASNAGRGLGLLANATNMFKAGVSALGGPIGALITVTTLAGTALAMYSESLGDAEKKARDLANAEEEAISSVGDKVQKLSQSERESTLLAETYNRLANEVNSGTLSEDKAIKKKENMAFVLKQLKETVNEEAIVYDESQKIKISSLKDFVTEEKRKLVTDVDLANREQQLLEADIKAYIDGNYNKVESLSLLQRAEEAYYLWKADREKKFLQDEKEKQFNLSQQEQSLVKELSTQNLSEGERKKKQYQLEQVQHSLDVVNKGVATLTQRQDESMANAINARFASRIEESKKRMEKLGMSAKDLSFLLDDDSIEPHAGGTVEPPKDKAAEKAERAAEKAKKEELKRVKASVENPKTTYEAIKNKNKETSALRDLTEDEKNKEKEAKKIYVNAIVSAIKSISGKSGFANI